VVVELDEMVQLIHIPIVRVISIEQVDVVRDGRSKNEGDSKAPLDSQE